MTVEAIKAAIAELPEEERHSLAMWLNDLDYDAWDKEMVKDFSPGGRGHHVVEKVKRDIAEGKARPMEEASLRAENPARDVSVENAPGVLGKVQRSS